MHKFRLGFGKRKSRIIMLLWCVPHLTRSKEPTYPYCICGKWNLVSPMSSV